MSPRPSDARLTGVRTCGICQETKAVTDFYPRHRGRGPSDTTVNCRSCHKKDTARRKPDAHRAGHLRRTFGLTVADYAALLEVQGGLCAICRQPETAVSHKNGLPVPLCVDHCHETGRVRGLLCRKCNSGIGMFGDNPVLVQSAIGYLEMAS